MNNTESSMTGMKPKDAIKLDTVPLDIEYPEETILPEDGLYRYLYQPGEQHGDKKRWATDLIWSERAFVREELMHVSEDTLVPPDWVSEWK